MSKRGLDNELGEFELTTCRNQGDLFEDCEYLEEHPCDAIDFITKFMNSEIAASMDKDVSMCHTWGTKQIYETLFSMVNIKRRESEVYTDSRSLFWVGYMYRYWVWWLGESSKEVIRKVPAELACGMYTGLHTLDVKQAIIMLKQAKQKH